jgi:hypothetical protein
MGNNIISYSLWGKEPMYTIGAIRNAELAEEIYSDWICRFYVGDDVPEDIVDELKSFDNTEVITMPHKENDWEAMFWRFYAVTPDAEFVIFRDTDSRLSMREYEAVLEWQLSQKSLHIMRDHPYHSEAIMGGMWGCRPRETISTINREIYALIADNVFDRNDKNVIGLETVIDDWLVQQKLRTSDEEHLPEDERGNYLKPHQYNEKGIDQIFLRYVIYKLLWNDAHIHDSFPVYNCWSGRFDYQPHPNYKETNTGFPTIRGKDWNNFVGQVYDQFNNPVEEYANMLKQRDSKIYEDWNES